MKEYIMATYEILKNIVRNSSNLTLNQSIQHDVLKEIVLIAKDSGSQVTLPTRLPYDLLEELSAIGGSNLTFVNGEFPAKVSG